MSALIQNMFGGAIAFGFCVIGLFFLKFWRRTRDPFFGAFALAFFLMGGGRIVEAILRNANESNPMVYLIRSLGFAIIIFAIVQKNVADKK
jgi:hypothetical protein